MFCFVMFSKFTFFAKNFKILAGKSICTEDQFSKLSWRLGFSCRFPVVAKCSEISLPIIKSGNTNHVLNNLKKIYLPQFSAKFVRLH